MVEFFRNFKAQKMAGSQVIKMGLQLMNMTFNPIIKTCFIILVVALFWLNCLLPPPMNFLYAMSLKLKVSPHLYPMETEKHEVAKIIILS